LGLPAFYPLEFDSSLNTERAALYAHGVFIKVVFILRDIFGASFALFLFSSFSLIVSVYFFFLAPNNKIC